MQNRKRILRLLAAGCAMLVMILDARTALLSAQSGLQLCIKTVIPSLYPFFVLSGIINSSLFGHDFRITGPVGRLCKIPKGGESLLFVGFLAGYPVGAQLIAQSYKNGSISKETAHRMLGFCNNAGPAFLFGMLSPLFANSFVPWVIWGVHIASALTVGRFLPEKGESRCSITPMSPMSLPQSLGIATRNMASVCGWVITFRVIIGFCNRWFLWLFPEEGQILLTGFLELSNGIVLLKNLPSEGLRFILSSAMLSLGGLCVGMQTLSVTEGLGSGYYFPGKAAQCLLSVGFSLLLQPILFQSEHAISVGILPIVCTIVLTVVYFLLLRGKKVVAFTKSLLYNISNKCRKEPHYAVSQENNPLL